MTNRIIELAASLRGTLQPMVAAARVDRRNGLERDPTITKAVNAYLKAQPMAYGGLKAFCLEWDILPQSLLGRIRRDNEAIAKKTSKTQ